MSPFKKPLTSESIRTTLEAFWSKALEIESTRKGLAVAVPQTFPDGWQMVVEIENHLPSGIKLTDQGRTLEWLSAQGHNTDTQGMSRHLQEICEECHIEQDGLEIHRWIPKQVDGEDIHLFAEALVNIAHLHVLREPKPRTLDIPDQTLQKIFRDRNLQADTHMALDGQTRKKIRIDYVVQNQDHLKAFQVIRRHGRILNTMEQWGFRWNDLRSTHKDLQAAMIYDPHHQDVDADSLAIGEKVCSLFCSYEDTNRIHEFLESK